MNKLTFLGSGGGRIVVSHQLRGTGGFVINLGDKQVHVDPGPGALVNANKFDVKPTKTDIIFVSHGHIDHVNDVNALIDAITLGGAKGKKGILISTKKVISGNDETSSWINSYYKDLLEDSFKVEAGEDVKDEELKFTIVGTKHDEECIGFILDNGNVKIGYTGDTAYFAELGKQFKEVDILILNVLRPGKDEWKTHMSSQDVVRVLKKAKPELAIIQHFGAKMIRADPIYEARWIQKETGIRTIAATDGLDIGLRKAKSD